MPKTAYASVPSSTDIVIGEIAPTADGFSLDNVYSLFSVLTGNSEDGSKSRAEVEAYYQSKGRVIAGTGCDVPALNADDYAKPIYVTFGGIQWNVVFLTVNNDGELVLDLWQAEPTIADEPMSDGLSAKSTALNNPSSVYGTSYMRCQVLGNGGKYFNYDDPNNPVYKTSDPKTSAYYEFAQGKYSRFLDAPEKVKYQESENAPQTGKHGNNFPSDAYGTPANGTWSGSNNYGAEPLLKEGYSDWKYDKIWLASYTEICGGGVWGYPAARSTKTTSPTWARSGMHSYGAVDDAQRYYCFNNGGGNYGNGSDLSNIAHAVRPAIHLNLNSLGYSCADVEVEYNGSAQTLDGTANWFNSGDMIVNYVDGTMQDVGTYNVTVSISPNSELKWSDGTTSQKSITFTITKKPLTIYFDTDGAGFPVPKFADTGEIYTRDGVAGDSTYPVLGLVYYKKGANASTATSSPPNTTGMWVARAVVTNDCNYTTDPETYEYEWEVTLYPVAQPIFESTATTTAAVDYNGGNQTIKIDGVDTTKMSEPVVDGDVVSKTLSGTTLTLVVKNAGTYSVKFSLRTDGDLPYKWAGIEDDTKATGQLTLTLTVNKATAKVTVNAPTDRDKGTAYSNWEWGANTYVNVAIDSGAFDGDNVVLDVKWVNGAGATSGLGGVALNGTDGVYTFAMSKTGSFTLCVELAESGGDNANYKFDGKYINFEITGQAIDFENVDWQYKIDNKGAGIAIDGETANYTTTYSVGYTGSSYSFLVDESSLPDGLYVKARDGAESGKDVGEYTVTVTIASNSDMVVFADTVFTLKFIVEKGEYDIDFVWVYSYTGLTVPKEYVIAPEYNGREITVSLMQRVNGALMAIPESELKVSYSGNKGKAINPYTAKATFTSVNPNYNAPAPLTFEWEITPKIINVVWDDDTVYDSEGNEYFTRVLLVDDPAFADQVEYYYYYNDQPYGEGVTALAKIYAAAGDGMATVTVEVRLKDDAKDSYRLNDASGNDCREDFDIGDTKTTATVSVEVSGVYSTATVNIKVTGEGMSSSYYTIEYYKAESLTNVGEKVENFDAKTADAGTYVAVISFVDGWDEEYRLKPSRVLFEIAPMEIAIPEVGEMTFDGNTLDLKDYLGGSYADYAKYIDIVGTSQRDAGTYTAYLTLTTKNYIWAMPAEEGGATAAKYSLARISLAAEELSVSVDRSMLTLPWTINKAQLTANWNLSGKEGAVINALSAYKDAINEGLIDVELIIRYYDNDKNMLDTVEFAGGNSYLVDAILSGDDAGNFEFVNGVGSEKNATAMVEYSIKKSGLSAAMGAVKDFMTKTVMGMPLWVWLLIALVILLVLIIIIAVACKRRKSKEEREEARERREEERQRKEEEKQRKEEERQRREEERQAQKERLETERELAKAKQEAELEKIRMQAGMAGMGMAGAGMASMAMQQPVQQVPVQQPVQQVQSAPAADNSAVMKLEMELAEMRAKLAAQQQPAQQQDNSAMMRMEMELAEMRAKLAAQQQPAQQQDNSAMMRMEMELAEMRAKLAAAQSVQPMPMQYQQQMLPSAQHDGALDDIKAQLAVMRAEQQASKEINAMKTELEIAKYASQQAQQHGYTVYEQSPAPNTVRPAGGAELLGDALIAAFTKIMSQGRVVHEQPAPQVENNAPKALPHYPSDAVVTTTTTVDTTNKQPARRERAEFTDVDGFYDKFE